MDLENSTQIRLANGLSTLVREQVTAQAARWYFTHKKHLLLKVRSYKDDILAKGGGRSGRTSTWEQRFFVATAPHKIHANIEQ